MATGDGGGDNASELSSSETLETETLEREAISSSKLQESDRFDELREKRFSEVLVFPDEPEETEEL